MKNPPLETPSPYPMRINKYLAQQGFATRRAADELVSKERVFINGRVAQIGDKVLEKDVVEVRAGSKRGKASAVKLAYYVYNKPRGVITHSPGKGETDIREQLPELAQKLGLFPVGRLDKDSHGLIILTNDGRITDRLLNPDKAHDKEYAVRTKLPLRESFKTYMEKGVDIEGYMTKPAKVSLTGDHAFTITLTEGKKHQIRRMVVAMHNEVIDLKRTRVMNIRLGKMGAGTYREIVGKELEEFLELLGLKGK